MKSIIAGICGAACALAMASSASAVQRTFVASYGNDANPCSLTQPCRGFAAAVAQTSAAGEVIVLDSAGYGPVTITQSVSIVAPAGVYAGISVFSGDGITVAVAPGDKVVLRGLTINGQGGNDGIVVQSGGEVHIEHCSVANMLVFGIRVVGYGGARTHIRDCTVHSNGGSGLWLTTAGTAEVYVTDSRFARNAGGIGVSGSLLVGTRVIVEGNIGNGVGVGVIPGTSDPITLVLTDSAVAGNGGAGVSASGSFTGQSARVELLRSTIARNALAGVVANSPTGYGATLLVVTESSIVDNGAAGVTVNGANATAVVAGSTLAGNVGADVAQTDSAVVRTSQNNTLTGRGPADISGTLTPNPLK